MWNPQNNGNPLRGKFFLIFRSELWLWRRLGNYLLNRCLISIFSSLPWTVSYNYKWKSGSRSCLEIALTSLDLRERWMRTVIRFKILDQQPRLISRLLTSFFVSKYLSRFMNAMVLYFVASLFSSYRFIRHIFRRSSLEGLFVPRLFIFRSMFFKFNPFFVIHGSITELSEFWRFFVND